MTYYKLKSFNPKPGTILLSRIDGELTDIEIPGFWKHAFLYSGPGKIASFECEAVCEAVGEGVRINDLITAVTTKDYIMAIECIHPRADEIMALASAYAIKQVGKPYDYNLGLDEDSFYCAKLVWFAYDYACKQLGIPSLFQAENELGMPVETPDHMISLLKSGNFKVLFSSKD